MPSITGISSLSSGFAPEYQNVTSLELKGPAFGGGSFGDVYELVAVNGAPPPSPQVVKVLRENGSGSASRGFETIEKLQRKILDDNRGRRAAGKPALQGLPALRALPQFSFRGVMGGDPVFGYSADRLDTAGYVPLADVLDPTDDPEPRRRYVDHLTIGDRLLLAHELAEGAQALRDLSYIHADINPPNLFVNIGECHVAIIDFDSGAVTDDPKETPSTFGKKSDGEWVAPEILDQIAAHRSGPLVVRVDRHTDEWAFTVGIHYLLFLCGPFFVLRQSHSRWIRDYVTRFRWPAFDGADPLFTAGIESSHATYLDMLADLPAPVLKRMSHALNEGALNPARRVLPFHWLTDLAGAQEPLEILLFQAEPEVIVEGRPVRLTWRVAGSRWVHIDNGIGEVDEAGTCEVMPTGSGSYTLTAGARGGDELSESASVRVLPLPVLRTLSVPTPELSLRVVLRDRRAAAPTFQLAAPVVRLSAPTIRLAAPSIRLRLDVDLSVWIPASGGAGGSPPPTMPAARPVPPSGAGPRWVPRIGDVFERLCQRMRAELNARFGGEP
jgi:hypothetical protein